MTDFEAQMKDYDETLKSLNDLILLVKERNAFVDKEKQKEFKNALKQKRKMLETLKEKMLSAQRNEPNSFALLWSYKDFLPRFISIENAKIKEMNEIYCDFLKATHTTH